MSIHEILQKERNRIENLYDLTPSDEHLLTAFGEDYMFIATVICYMAKRLNVDIRACGDVVAVTSCLSSAVSCLATDETKAETRESQPLDIPTPAP